MAVSDTAMPRVPLSLRLPAHVVESVNDYARASNISKTDAFLHFVLKGMESEKSSGAHDQLDQIQSQLRQIEALVAAGKEGTLDSEALLVRNAIAKAAESFPAIERAYLFGSFARGEHDEESDVDVRIERDESMPFNLHDLFQFAKRIERMTGRKVDVVSTKDLKNESLAAAIEREKVLVYERAQR